MLEGLTKESVLANYYEKLDSLTEEEIELCAKVVGKEHKKWRIQNQESHIP